MIHIDANPMSALRIVFSAMLLLLSVLFFGHGAARANEKPELCKPESLPSEIQNRLKEEYGSKGSKR